MLNKLTLVIPSYERPKYLLRCINYYQGTEASLLICDGSKHENLECKRICEEKVNASYYHLPKLDFKERLHYINSKIKTGYACWLCDDEFQLIKGLRKSIEILERNENVATSIGKSLSFGIDEMGVYLREGYLYNEKAYSNQQANRIEEYFSHYCPTIDYAVWRVEAFKKAWDFVVAIQSELSGSHELYRALFALLEGEHIIHSEIQWLRSDENPPIQQQIKKDINTNQKLLETRDDIEAAKYLNTAHNYGQKLSAMLILLMRTSHAWFVDNRKLLYNLEICAKKGWSKEQQKTVNRRQE